MSTSGAGTPAARRLEPGARRALLIKPAAGAGERVSNGAVLGPGFFDRDTVAVARALLGKLLVREIEGKRLWGRLVEVEAYLGPDDLAAHSAGGRRTPRTEVMFGPPGRAYVYLTYGMHHCLNFVTRSEGTPQAVLVRAIEPGPGVARATGPGLVCRALEIDRRLNGVELTPPQLYVVDDHAPRQRVFVTPRIGVENSGDWAGRPLRFCWDSPYLSRRLKKI